MRNFLNVYLLFAFLFSVTFLSAQTRSSFDGVQGGVWKDTDGVPIQAHGGQVSKIGDKWWWVGENRSDDRSVMLYSSDDLYNWESHGKVMRVVSNRTDLDNSSYFTALYGHLSSAEKDLIYEGISSKKVIERPKLIHNEKTGKYIIWFHADDSNYGAAAAGVAIADEITGPYTFIKRSRLHQLPDDEYSQPNQSYEKKSNRGMARDMTLFKDDDGTAYIIYSSEENMTMFISRLNDEYTDLDVAQTPVGLAKNGVDFIRLFPGAQREAPAMFKYNNKYYMITSGATGWDPNQARYWVADEIFGEWTNMGDPCVSQSGIPYPTSTTFATQSTNVIPVDPENGKFIYMGDRWKSSNLSDSRYVWLPIYITPTGMIELRSMTDWDLSIFDDINNVRVNPDCFSSVYFIDEQLPTTIPVQVRDADGWKTENAPLVWNKKIKSLPPAALTMISGNFDFEGIDESSVTVKAVNIPKGLLYFIDSGAKAGSDLFDLIVKNKFALAPNLINTEVCDQKFSSQSGWGYTGSIGTDIDYKNEKSRDAFESGWWAYDNKTIDYKMRVSGNGKYRVTVGFQEWWNTGRNMRISLIYDSNAIANKTVNLGDFQNQTESTQDYTFELTDLKTSNPYITIRVSKTWGADAVMSWLSLSSLDLSSLEIAINTAKTIKNDDNHYTPERFAVFTQALEEAIAVRDKPNATEDEKYRAENKLTISMLNLESPDTSSLETLIQRAESLQNNDNRYIADEFNNMIVALQKAKGVMNNLNASQEEVDLIESVLSEALMDLKYNFENEIYVQIAPIPSQEYTGNAITPDLIITDANNSLLTDGKLIEGTHYTVIYTDNTEISDNPVVTITGKGSYEGVRNVTFDIVITTNIDEYLSVNTALNVYPNPVELGQPIYIDLKDELNQDADINIYTMTGQLVKTQKQARGLTKVDLDLPIGIYAVSVNQKRAVLIVK